MTIGLIIKKMLALNQRFFMKFVTRLVCTGTSIFMHPDLSVFCFAVTKIVFETNLSKLTLPGSFYFLKQIIFIMW